MKKITIIVLSVLLIISVGALLYVKIIKPTLEEEAVSAVTPITISKPDLHLSFTYPSGEDAYTLVEPPIPPSTSDGLKKVFFIMDKSEYQEFSSSTEPREAPPTVSIFVFKEIDSAENTERPDRMTRLRAFAEQGQKYTSYSLKTTEPEEIELDGVGALHYRATGLYEQDVYIVGYKEKIYLFIGQYMAETDGIFTMFKEMLPTVAFD